MRHIGLAGFLFSFWLALSGHYTPVLVAAGAVSAALCVFAMIRVRVADAEASDRAPRGAVTYFPWLIREIAKSAWAVTKIILHPSLPISPTMTVFEQARRPRPALHLCEFDHAHARNDHRRRERNELLSMRS